MIVDRFSGLMSGCGSLIIELCPMKILDKYSFSYIPSWTRQHVHSHLQWFHLWLYQALVYQRLASQLQCNASQSHKCSQNLCTSNLAKKNVMFVELNLYLTSFLPHRAHRTCSLESTPSTSSSWLAYFYYPVIYYAPHFVNIFP